MSCVQGCELRQHKQHQPELSSAASELSDTRAQWHRAGGYTDLSTVQCCLLQPQGVTGTQSCQIPSATSEFMDLRQIWNDSWETYLGDQASRRKAAEVCPHIHWHPSRKQQVSYKLKDVFILTQSRLQIPAITTSQFQSQDIITRHPCLPLGEFFSNATMKERNVMEVPPTASATPHWYFRTWFYSCCPHSKSASFNGLLRNTANHSPFLRLQNWDTVQSNPGPHSLRTDQAEVDAGPTEQHVMTAVIDFPQSNSAGLKSPVSGGVVAKEDTSKRFFVWHERCWLVARLGSSTSP